MSAGSLLSGLFAHTPDPAKPEPEATERIFLKTPWVYSGQDNSEISRLLAKPAKPHGFTVILQSTAHLEFIPYVGTSGMTVAGDPPLNLAELMTAMQLFMDGKHIAKTDLPLKLRFSGGGDYEDFRIFTQKRGLIIAQPLPDPAVTQMPLELSPREVA